ncbi:MAG: glyoxylate reductase [Candidatus Bathyarchaeia archaeon]
MAKPKVYVTRPLVPPYLEVLREVCDVEVRQAERPPTREELKAALHDKDGLLCLLTDKIDGEVMDAGPRLVVISTMSVGYDHINIPDATKRGIYVTYTPGVLTDATADFAWALLMASARRVAEADRFIRGGKWVVGWAPGFMLGVDIYGKTLGILGLGRIGQAVAKRAKGFGMRLLYYDIVRPPPEVERSLGIEYTSLEGLLKESDFLSVHVALTKETHHLIGEKQLRMMKPTAHLVNTSRGAVVDEEALARALKEGWIAGAGLDVFEKEPIDADNPLIGLENAVLAPHIASASKEARSKMAELAARNLVSVLKGEMPPHLVNTEVLAIRPLSQAKRT